MGRDPDVVEVLEDVLGDPIVEDALAFDDLVLLRIEGGRVVLEVLDQRTGLRSFVENLRLALIDATTAAHRSVPWFVDVHLGCRGSVCTLNTWQVTSVTLGKCNARQVMSAAAGPCGATK